MDNENIKTTETEVKPDEKEKETQEETLTVEQQLQKVIAQNQALMNDIAKYRKTSEKNASEAAEWKKKYNSTLSAQEQASQEKAEKEAERDAKFAELLRENQVNKYVRSFMSQGYSEELAQKAAESMYDGNTEEFLKVQAQATEATIKAKEAEWLRSRPDVHAGTGSTQITKEQFANMDVVERSMLRTKDPETYERLVGRK